ncbi:MAG: hypothetical protein KC591_16045 [Gemmatimonadetes bacterium]|nr:hypothetical protein [Gemmatimonadota bacterium]
MTVQNREKRKLVEQFEVFKAISFPFVCVGLTFVVLDLTTSTTTMELLPVATQIGLACWVGLSTMIGLIRSWRAHR